MLRTDSEREIIYTPAPADASNAVANVFLGLLVISLVAFLAYYVAVIVPASNVHPTSTIIQRDVERQVVVPAPSAPAPLDTTAPPVAPAAPVDNSAPSNQ